MKIFDCTTRDNRVYESVSVSNMQLIRAWAASFSTDRSLHRVPSHATHHLLRIMRLLRCMHALLREGHDYLATSAVI